jgi:hypothetical protein
MWLDNDMNDTERPTKSIRADRVEFGMEIYYAGITRTAIEVHNDYSPGNGKHGSADILWLDGTQELFPANHTVYQVL